MLYPEPPDGSLSGMPPFLEQPAASPASPLPTSSRDRIGTLDRVVSTRGGLVSTVVPLPAGQGDPAYRICQAMLGDVGLVLDAPDAPLAADQLGPGALDGAGSGTVLTRAADLAVVEAIERWSSVVVTPGQLVAATADQLPGAVLDLTRVPACSAAELAHPRCPLTRLDPAAPQRWVRGVDLTSGAPVWVPAVMTYLGLQQWPSEHWWLPISTGCAAHTDPAAALLGGLLEVVERDVLTLTWLHSLPLPEIDLSGSPLAGLPAEAARNGSGTTRLFDGTLDTGVPTVYAVNTSSGPVATVVGAATCSTAEAAVRKVLGEVQSCRIALEATPAVGDDLDAFLFAVEGARWMAAPERADAFGFLTGATPTRRLADLAPLAGTGPREQLRSVLNRLAELGCRPVAVDLTTREARAAGLVVVRVIVPELQPMTFNLRARYLAHPRVFDGPRSSGYTPRAESALNPLPQPMA